MRTLARSTALICLLALSTFGLAQSNHVLPNGTDIKVRTDTAIPAKPAANARYGATVSEDIKDSSGAVVIPRNSRASLVAVPNSDGKDVTLDLRSVSVNGRRYALASKTDAATSRPGGLGANQRTAKYVGGGAGGAGAQVFTGRKKSIPAETQLSFKTAQDLEMRPVSSHSSSGLQKR